MTRLVNQADRERIRVSLDETLVVEAAAGTGKTSELVRRLINILAEGRGTVQTVAALTFTEKAAGELKLRLRAALEEERRAAPGGTPRGANLERALAHLEEARISTIHGFCKDLLQERPVEACVDPQLQILAEAEAKALYEQAFDRWLEGRLEDPPEGLRRALRRRSRPDGESSPTAQLRRAGWLLAEWRDLGAPWRRQPFDRPAAIDALVERVHDVADRLAVCSNTGDRLYGDTWRVRRLSADVRLAEQVRSREYDGLEAALVELGTDSKFRRPGKGSARNYGGSVAHGQILAAHGQLLARLDEFACQANADLAALLQRELLETINRYEELKARTGALDFFDLLLKTRDLVRDRRDVRAEFQQRFTHILVDEFQDTDPLQAEILLLLTSADPSTVRWRVWSQRLASSSSLGIRSSRSIASGEPTSGLIRR